MKKISQYISYLIFRLMVLIFSFLPFGAIYAISNFLAWILEKVIKYRKDVILTNLNIAFPNQTDLERQQTMKAYYQYMADLAVESIKGPSIPKEQLHKRFFSTNALERKILFMIFRSRNRVPLIKLSPPWKTCGVKKSADPQ